MKAIPLVISSLLLCLLQGLATYGAMVTWVVPKYRNFSFLVALGLALLFAIIHTAFARLQIHAVSVMGSAASLLSSSSFFRIPSWLIWKELVDLQTSMVVSASRTFSPITVSAPPCGSDLHGNGCAGGSSLISMLSRLSHELNTSLNAILGAAQVLSSSSDDELVHIIMHSAKVMANQVSDFIDLVHCEEHALLLSCRTFRLHYVMDRINAAFQEEADRLGVVLDFKLAPDTPTVLVGDCYRLRQVLTNVLCNAFHAVQMIGDGHRGRITISVSPATEPSKVEFSVSDNGCGICEQDQQGLFTPFYQTSTSEANTQAWPGVGLGLCLSKHFVTLMGGTIDVHSTLNVGTSVFFTIPVSHGIPHDSDSSKILSPHLAEIGARISRFPHRHGHGRASSPIIGPNLEKLSIATSSYSFHSASRSHTRLPGQLSSRFSGNMVLSDRGSSSQIRLPALTPHAAGATSPIPAIAPPPPTLHCPPPRRSSRSRLTPKSGKSISSQKSTSPVECKPPVQFPAVATTTTTKTDDGPIGRTTTDDYYNTFTPQEEEQPLSSKASASQKTTGRLLVVEGSDGPVDAPGLHSDVAATPQLTVEEEPTSSPSNRMDSSILPKSSEFSSSRRSLKSNPPRKDLASPVLTMKGIDEMTSAQGKLWLAANLNLTSIRRSLTAMEIYAEPTGRSLSLVAPPGGGGLQSALSATPTSGRRNIGGGAGTAVAGDEFNIGVGPSSPEASCAPGCKSTASAREINVDLASKPLTVFIVDDNAINRILLRRIVQMGLQCNVQVFESAIDTLESIKAKGFDPERERGIVLTDIHMPKMTGIEMATQLRIMFGPEVLPIIAITADHCDGLHEECILSGIQAVLTKPVMADHLQQTVEWVMTRSWGCVPLGYIIKSHPD